MKVQSIPPARFVMMIGLALISPALAVVNPITVKAGVVTKPVAETDDPPKALPESDYASGESSSLDAEPPAELPITPAGEALPASPPVPGDMPLIEGNAMSYRLASAPGDSPLLFFLLTIGGAIIRKTRYPASLRWRK